MAPRSPLRRAVAWTALLLVLAVPAWAALISQQQEVEIGRQGARKLEARYRVVTDLGMQERVTRIGQAVAAQGTRDLVYHFKVLDADQINALAFPGGFIYATRGLMNAMPDDQLAFVLGHEVAHVEKRHSVQQMEADMYKQAGLAALLGLLGKGNVSQSTAQTVRIADMVIDNQYSQHHEREADREGMLLMARAGYDPHAAVAALETLQRNSRGNEMSGFLNSILSSHPLTSERIENARKMADEIPFQPRTAAPAPAPAPAAAPRPQAPAPAPRQTSGSPRPVFTPVPTP